MLLNDCVRFVYAKRRFCWKERVSVTKLVMGLHILPIRYRILYKISLTIFKCIHGSARATNHPGMVRTVQELTSGILCLGLGHFCPRIY